MPKGQKKPPVGFANYRRTQAPTIEAMRSPGNFKLKDADYKAGDYIVRDPSTGDLEGMSAVEFEENFEIARTRKPKATTETAVVEQAQVAEQAS